MLGWGGEVGETLTFGTRGVGGLLARLIAGTSVRQIHTQIKQNWHVLEMFFPSFGAREALFILVCPHFVSPMFWESVKIHATGQKPVFAFCISSKIQLVTYLSTLTLGFVWNLEMMMIIITIAVQYPSFHFHTHCCFDTEFLKCHIMH